MLTLTVAGKSSRPALGIQKEVRPVEEQEIGTRPRVRVVERVGLIVERDRRPRPRPSDGRARCRIELVPDERVAGLARAAKFETLRAKFAISYAPGVHAGSDRMTGCISADGERHRRRHDPLLGVRARERHLVADVGDWCGSRVVCARHGTAARQPAQTARDRRIGFMSLR